MSNDASNQLPVEEIGAAVDAARLVKTATDLIEVPSPTLSAGDVADRLESILQADGFQVERPVADWPQSPAVVIRLDSGKPGRVMQFDTHLDTVHLPFVPPREDDGKLYGSGAADMKGGLACCVETMRVLRQLDCLPGGSILLTAHDHHEGPWGDKRQAMALIKEGYTGDAALFPEYLASHLPIAGRGMAIVEITVQRDGDPVHEVLRPDNLPDVLGTGVELAQRLKDLGTEISVSTHPYSGHDSFFLGTISCGEIYNQAATECHLKGTRRWVGPGSEPTVRAQIHQILDEVAAASNTRIDVKFRISGDAFQVDPEDPFVGAFQNAHSAICGAPLPLAGKPFVDDGNVYFEFAGIPVLTHGPASTGAHTVNECVPISELVRAAKVFALTAIDYCSPDTD
jgi:acetylornithine deacetylase/succinyl-diaminopimelate desuccinylase-like protein